MTMVFTKKLLDGPKEGHKVQFRADKKASLYIVTAVQLAKKADKT